MTPLARYGVELEGPHKGLKTLVLLSAVLHETNAVRSLSAGREVEHLWLERQYGEQFNWPELTQALDWFRGKATLLMLDDGDIPPPHLLARVALVLRVPRSCARAAQFATHQQCLTGGPFEGAEVTVQLPARQFNPDDYKKDEAFRP